MTPKRCVLNVATHGWYLNGQTRLETSLKEHGFSGDFLKWTGHLPDGSPAHATVPYAFKSYAFQHAVKAGYTSILWLDASCWAIRPVEPLFEEIEAQGHVLSFEGFMAGQWLKDAALTTLNVTRDEAMQMPLFGGMFIGLDVTNPRTVRWLDRFVELSQDGHTLVGHHDNVNGCHSADPRCLGHTHDQSVGSVLAYQLGMQITYPPLWRDWAKPNPDPRTIILAGGM